MFPDYPILSYPIITKHRDQIEGFLGLVAKPENGDNKSRPRLDARDLRRFFLCLVLKPEMSVRNSRSRLVVRDWIEEILIQVSRLKKWLFLTSGTWAEHILEYVNTRTPPLLSKYVMSAFMDTTHDLLTLATTFHHIVTACQLSFPANCTLPPMVFKCNQRITNYPVASLCSDRVGDSFHTAARPSTNLTWSSLYRRKDIMSRRLKGNCCLSGLSSPKWRLSPDKSTFYKALVSKSAAAKLSMIFF